MSFQSHSSPSSDFQLAFESLPNYAIFVAADEPFRIIGATRRLLQYLGRNRHQAIGLPLFEVFQFDWQKHDTYASVVHAVRNAIRTTHEQQLEATRFNVQSTSDEFEERYWNLTFTPVSDDLNTIKGVIITAVDITGTNREVPKSRKTLVESILGASFDGIYALEAVRKVTGEIVDFRYRFANHITANFLGQTPESIVGQRMLELIPENRSNGFFDLFCRALANGETIQDQTYFISSQMTHWFDFVIVPISDDTLVVTIHDISEQKRDEEALRTQKAQLEGSLADLRIANNNLERFAFAASHDLQEPLRKVQMFCNLLLDHSGDTLDEKAQNYLSKILDSTGRMTQLVKDILQFSEQSEEVRYDYRVDMNELLTNVESDLNAIIRHQHAHITRAELPPVSGNPLQLSQLFYNVYHNALKFSRTQVGGSQIAITYRHISHNDMRDKSKQYIAITVADNGIGFDEKYAAKIFELFSRLHSVTSYAGSGIGLALCKKIAQNHGGDIIALSPNQTGASFDVILPLA